MMTHYDSHIARLRASVCEPPPHLRTYTDKVRDDPHSITDDDIDSLKEHGCSEDELFEHAVSAAVQAGLLRLDAALRVLG
jgi:hypothetical protein